jgi:hypothetical protein
LYEGCAPDLRVHASLLDARSRQEFLVERMGRPNK